MTYKVTWVIELDADSLQAAAEIALQVQRDSESTAIRFTSADRAGEVLNDNR